MSLVEKTKRRMEKTDMVMKMATTKEENGVFAK